MLGLSNSDEVREFVYPEFRDAMSLSDCELFWKSDLGVLTKTMYAKL